MDQGKIYDCHHEIAQPVIGIQENAIRADFVESVTMKQQVQNRRFNTTTLAHITKCSRIVRRGLVCPNSCAIWIWHYPSTPFKQMAAIFIFLFVSSSLDKALSFRECLTPQHGLVWHDMAWHGIVVLVLSSVSRVFCHGQRKLKCVLSASSCL